MSVLVIAEAGVNHDGNLSRALQLVEIAHDAKADVVKFQIFTASTCHGAYKDILAPLSLTYDEHRQIKAHAERLGLRYLASCFDVAAVDFVADMGCEYAKLASSEITNYPLIRHVVNKGLKPIISTGMSVWHEVASAYAITGTCLLLHCVSNYPTAPEHCNLAAIPAMAADFDCPVGFSDHTLGFDAMVAAVAIGAVAIEKHFTYDPTATGPDHHMSLSPENLRGYVAGVRRTEAMLGTGEKVLQPGEAEMQKIARGRWT